MTETELLALAICGTNDSRPPCLHACAWCLHEARAELAAIEVMHALGQGHDGRTTGQSDAESLGGMAGNHG